MSHHLAAPLFDSENGREEQQHDYNSFFACGPRARSRHAVASRVSSLALALLSFPGISLQPGDRVAILASPPRVSDDESETAEEARRRAGLDASASASLSASASPRPRPAPPLPRSAPLFPADAALEALLAAAAAGAVACPLNGRLPADSLAGLLSSLRPRVLFAPRGGTRGCEEAVAAALAAAAASRERGGGGGHSSGDWDEGEEAFFGLPRGPEAPVVVWLDDNESLSSSSSSSFGSSLLPPHVAQASSVALLSHGTREKRSSLSPSSFTPKFAPGDAAAVVFTSGTTDPSGRPRGALLSHSALHFQSRVKVERMRLCAQDAVLHAAPLFHVAGLSAAGAALLSRCRRNALLEAGGWTRQGGWRAAVEGEVTALSAVSAMVFDLAAENGAELLLRRGGRRERDEEVTENRPPPLSSVRVALVGGGAPPPARLLAAAFPSPTVRVLTAYGLTEASSSVLWGEVVAGVGVGVGVGELRASENSSSPPGIEVAVAVFEEESSSSSSSSSPPPSSSSSPSSSLSWRPAREGEEGELLTRGPHVFRGYWRDAAATRRAFLPASSCSSDSTTATPVLLPWLRTGDAAAVRPGGETASSIRVLGRGADAIRVGGETVHASSAEAALLQSLTSTSSAASSKAAPVSGVALVGLPHARLGQVVAALVALKPGITWRGDVVVAAASEEEQGRRPPPPSAGCGVPLSLSTLRAAARAAGLPGHALPRHAVATWAPLPTKGPLAKLDRAEALRQVERAVLAGEEEEVDDRPRPRL